jgi:hypothetical protein
MTRDLGELVGSLRKLNGEIVSSCAEIHGAGQNLSKDMDDVIANIRVHGDVAGALDSVRAILRRMSRSLGNSMPDMDLEAERSEACLSENNSPHMRQAGRLAYADPRRFGDNVELF